MRIVRRRDEAVRVIAWRAQLTTNPIFFKFPPPAHALAADHPDPTPVPEFTRSDALDLNEKYCVRLLVRAVRGGGSPDPKRARL